MFCQSDWMALHDQLRALRNDSEATHDVPYQWLCVATDFRLNNRQLPTTASKSSSIFVMYWKSYKLCCANLIKLSYS